jgi:hypothetical protein
MSAFFRYLLCAAVVIPAVLSPLYGKEPQQNKKNSNAGYFLTALIDCRKIEAPSAREKQLVSILDHLERKSCQLAIESSDLSAEIENIINESGISPARAAALRLKAQQVKRLAGQVAVITESKHKSSQQVLKECRIISINKELGIVAIEAGANHGVFKGMVFHTLPGNPPAELKISITRPDISGATVTKGDINQLSSGMRISAVESRGSTQ